MDADSATQREIAVYAKPYHGRDSRKLEKYRAEVEAARKIKEYLNSRIVPGQPKTFDYDNIARELGLDLETVKRLLFPIGHGHHGILL